MNAFLNFKPLFLSGLGALLLVSCARQHSAVDNEELAFKQSILALQKQIEEANRSKILSTEANEDGSFTTKVRSVSYDVWIKYNFADKAQAFVPDTSEGWDVGFQRFKLQTNGGLTYSKGQGGACLTNPALTDFNAAASSNSTALGCTNASFSPDTNVSEIAAGGVQTNYVGNNVLNKWFNYTFAFLQPNYNVFIIRSSTGNEYYLFQITGYYNSEGTSAHPTVRWKQIPY
ncbi:HmuY protein [Leptospira weilii str. 2006001853]|uniref:HmuY protein n=1 Tax=Leptospira weilii str. 2006001853 TaxID=1001589 RepID=A0A828YXC2_9LEPT|nr:HmuY family protein [Leptospira weilii]EKR62092.1 HmuY protein [Leptospira weilii str. 2006001853]EMN44608.1 HmuY protein [Leptospira weilii str. LNT 1234]QDK25100.1 heme-binding protein HmuY [Leptospira weilii]QDK29004.1 heme-binding protein HmuY [Leptospira weilii]